MFRDTRRNLKDIKALQKLVIHNKRHKGGLVTYIRKNSSYRVAGKNV